MCIEILPGAPPTPRRTAARRALGGLSLLLLIAAGQSGTGPWTLRMKFMPGEVLKLQTKMLVDMSVPLPGKAAPITQRMALDMLQQVKTLRTLPGGGGETETTILRSNGTMNGQPIHLPANQPITMTLDARGNTLSMKGLPNNTPGMAVLNQIFGSGGLKTTGSYLPAKPVRIGDTWKDKIVLPGFSGSGYALSELVRLERVGSYQTARIHSRIALPLKMMLDASQKLTTQADQAVGTMAGTLNMVVDSNFAIAEGRSVRSAGSGGMTMTITFKAPPAGSKGAVGAANVPKPVTMVMKLQVGNNLSE